MSEFEERIRDLLQAPVSLGMPLSCEIEETMAAERVRRARARKDGEYSILPVLLRRSVQWEIVPPEVAVPICRNGYGIEDVVPAGAWGGGLVRGSPPR